MTYTKQRKQEAVVAMARAFLNRGGLIQYDQSRLDPNHITFSRRELFALPEEATKQHTTHIDCSGFVYAVLYQTFGYHLKENLTHNMFDLEDIKVFHYDVTGHETEEDRQNALNEFRNTLEVGDIIVFEFGGNGHAMLYTGNGKLMHSIPLGGDSDSYRHTTKHETFCPTGAIYEMDLSILTEAAPDGERSLFYFFQRGCFRFCILRPLDVVDEITESALRRSDPANQLENLVIQVLTSHPQGRSAAKDDTVAYQVEIANLGRKQVGANVTFEAPEGTVLIGGNDVSLPIPEGASVSATWCIRVQDAKGTKLAQPHITVNTMQVAAPEVFLGNNLRADEEDRLLKAAVAMQNSREDGVASIRSIYPRTLPEEFTSVAAALQDLYEIVDQPRGLALVRKTGSWAEAMLVPTFYGGMSVVSLDAPTIENRNDRVRRPRATALQPGDVIICADDIHGKEAFACVCLEQHLLYGKFERFGSVDFLKDNDVDIWMEALLGRNCFAVLRPALCEK